MDYVLISTLTTLFIALATSAYMLYCSSQKITGLVPAIIGTLGSYFTIVNSINLTIYSFEHTTPSYIFWIACTSLTIILAGMLAGFYWHPIKRDMVYQTLNTQLFNKNIILAIWLGTILLLTLWGFYVAFDNVAIFAVLLTSFACSKLYSFGKNATRDS